jgi:hypothetical protein
MMQRAARFPLRGSRHAQHVALLAILATALAIRLYGIFWDEGFLFHPDERWILSVASQLHWPADGNWRSLDPFWDPSSGHLRDFAYGHLPLYALRLAQAAVDRWLPLAGPWPTWLTERMRAVPADPLEKLAVIGRALVALADTATVAVLYALGRRLYGVKTGLLAAALMALAVLSIQIAHFFTVDTFATLFAIIALIGAVRLAEGADSRRDEIITGAAIGLATACKLTMSLLVIPLLLALPEQPGERRQATVRGIRILAIAAVVFALTNPFALVDVRTFAESMAVQMAVVRGWLDYPYTRQYHATWPYIYPLVQQWRWGLGPLLGTAAWVGIGWAGWRTARRQGSRGEKVVLAWVLPYFLLTAGWHAKFVRYLLPIVPFLCLFGAAWLLSLTKRPIGATLTALVLIGTLIYALAFMNIYRQRHPWLRTSAWIYAHVPAGSTIAVEHWDQALPVNLTTDTQVLAHDRYRQTTLELFDLEDEGRFDELANQLAAADYVVLASRRLYGTLSRWPERYPLSARYYRLLFGEQLGFRLVHADWSEPRLGRLVWREDPIADAGLPRPPWWIAARTTDGWAWHPGRADESFAVYDHPTPLVFARLQRLSAAEIRRRLAAKKRDIGPTR